MLLDRVLERSGPSYPLLAMGVAVAVCMSASSIATSYLLVAMRVPADLGPAVQVGVVVGFVVAAAYFIWKMYQESLPLTVALRPAHTPAQAREAWDVAERLPRRSVQYVLVAATLATFIGVSLIAVGPDAIPVDLFARGVLAAILGVAIECALIAPLMHAAMAPVRARLRSLHAPVVLGTSVAADTALQLGGVAGYVRELAGELDDVAIDAHRVVVEDIQAAARQAAALSDDLMILAGAAPFDPAPIAFCDLVSACVDDVRLGSSAGVRFACRFANVPGAVGDETQLGAAVSHLLQNAVLACGSGRGRVTVSTLVRSLGREELVGMWNGDCVTPGLYIGVTIHDDGVGMTDELRRVAREATVSGFQPRRSGMGLAVVFAVARRHGGAVALQSQLGGGTRVQLWVPHEGPLFGSAAH